MPVVLLRHIVAGVFCFRLLYLYCMPPTVLDIYQVKYKKTFSRGKKIRECFVVCEKVPTFASAFREQPLMSGERKSSLTG